MGREAVVGKQSPRGLVRNPPVEQKDAEKQAEGKKPEFGRMKRQD